MRQEVKTKIIAEAKKDRNECQHNSCYDFQLFSNENTEGYFVRYTKSSFNGRNFTEDYRWLCFDADGNRSNCDPIFESVKDENRFYMAMRPIESFTI